MDMENMMTPKAYSYVRFSTPEQERGDSFRRQTEAAEAYATLHGLELDDTLTLHDKGVSGFSGANVRKGALGQFLQAVDADEVEPGSFLLVENLDRVSRADPWEALPIFQQIINAEVTIVTLQDGKTYSKEEMRTNPMRILESLFTMIRANEESATKAKRLRAAWSNKRKSAGDKPMTARAPAWLRLSSDRQTFEPIDDRVAVIKRIFREADKGTGQHRIAQMLNEEGVETFGDTSRKADYWHRSYIAKILGNPAVFGTFVPHEVTWSDGKKTRKPLDRIPDYFPAVISKAVFQRVQGQKGSAARMRANGQVSNVLAGLAKCPRCGSTMTRVNKGRKGGTPYLVCTKAKAGAGCDYRIVRQSILEQAVEHAGTRQLVHEVPTGDEGLDKERKGLERAADGLAGAIDNILSEIAQGNASPALRRRLAEFETEQESVNEKLTEIETKQRQAGKRAIARAVKGLEGAFGDSRSTVVEKNAALRAAFDRCVIEYDEGRMAFFWKHGGSPTTVYFDTLD